jgi:hypothetical protein
VGGEGLAVERDYDLFEQFLDGFPVWRGHASGLLETRRKLEELTRRTSNECFAIHIPTREIVARVNVRSSRGQKPVVFQITYAPELADTRTQVLRLHGYEVITVVGNDAAKVVLGMHQACDLFVVGHAAPEETRREMVEWLRTNYPGVRILALNPPSIPQLVGADYNLKINGPETLLPVLAKALGGGPSGTQASR